MRRIEIPKIIKNFFIPGNYSINCSYLLKYRIMAERSTYEPIPSGLWIEAELRRRFEEEAVVVDAEKGYISVPSVNQRVDLEMQGWAADLIVNQFRQQGLRF